MAVQTQHDGLITTAWILGIIIAALGWIPLILSVVTLGFGVLIFSPLYLVALVLSIIGLTALRQVLRTNPEHCKRC